MLRVYLDDILQSVDDVININESFETSIVREDGFENTSPILREKSEATLEFTGASYRYICSKRRENYCEDISIRIVYSCDGSELDIFTGFIKQKEIEIRPDKGIGRATTIRDDSFSAKFRDFINVEIGLYNTKTRGCEDLATINQSYIFSTDPANIVASRVSKQGFDVLDTLQYFINYITNNEINIVSDYLTANKYAIAKGFALHSTSGTLDEIYPILSFEKLFDELKKKLNLYMAIEYDNNGTPYLRIEEESYFYSTETLLEIDGIPNGVTERIETNILYNKIEVGGSFNEVDDVFYEYYPKNRLVGWQDEAYTDCGSCAGDKDSTLNLVSDFIINSNIFYEALNTTPGDNYNNDEIYLFEYSVASSDRYATITTDPVFGEPIYNYGLNNEAVLTRWAGGAKCIALTRYSGNGFSVSTSGINTFINVDTSNVGVVEYAQENFQGVEIYDSGGNVSALDTSITNTYSPDIPPTFGYVDNASVFTVPTNGTYKFRARSTYLMCDYDNAFIDPAIYLRYSLIISVYSDNTFGTLIDEYSDDINPIRLPSGLPTETEMDITTPNITLTAGNTVFVKMLVFLSNAGAVINGDADFCETETVFELLFDDNTCTNTESTTDENIFELEFKHPVSESEYTNIKNNKKGTIIVNGFDYFIRELKYVPRKLSTFKLIGKESICSC